ncbi:MAG: hypothetical protein DRI61_14430 [Chloroflexi bacterium]|nr:MAG: hypothetical protein DRI61_14430 [Chloroflexota bacterium]
MKEGNNWEALAEKLSQWGLAEPVALFLKAVKPLSPLIGQGLLFLEPLVGYRSLRQYAELLEDEEGLESFVSSITREK